jgi:undecaprenyl phosphate N,N'-diacetylbacillosamine 1-phosphate transferase
MYRKFIKRLLDILIAITFCIFLIPFLLMAWLVIKMDDKGPIFYLGERLGKDGNVFKMYKLRTMKVKAQDIRNPDGSTFSSENDPRLTRIGKFLRKSSLDEVPQVINVLKGEMSFVGPRPDLPEHKEMYDFEEMKKLDVLPGITGYNQAYFRNSIIWKERLKNDVYYTKNISFLFDLKIIIKTFQGVILKKDIYTQENGR